MLVLSAFDIALNLEPYEDFDISLGFELGIVDNERDRGWHGAVGSQSPSKSAEKTALPQRRKKTGAGKAEQDLEANLYEDQVTLSELAHPLSPLTSIDRLRRTLACLGPCGRPCRC
jgi:hypothetical protein